MSYFINPAIAPYKKSHHDSLRKFHKDGLKDIFVKIKLKAKETINYFKQLPKSKKIVLLVSQILKIVIAIWNIIEHNKLPNQLAENRIEKVSLKKLIGRVESKNKWRNEELLTLKPELKKLNQKIDELKTLSNNLTGKYGNDFNVNNQFVKPLQSRQKYLSNTINKYESTIERNKGIVEDLNNDLDNNSANLKSLETRTNLRVFISFLTMFASSVADYIALRRTDSKLKRDRGIKKLIDEMVRQAVKDAGVKGMKRGQHVKARDPEYVESLRGGGESRTRSGMSIGKKIAIGAGAAAAGVGGALLGKKFGVHKRVAGLFKNAFAKRKAKSDPSSVFESIGPQTQKAVVPQTAAVSRNLNETQKSFDEINRKVSSSFDKFMRNKNNRMVFE